MNEPKLSEAIKTLNQAVTQTSLFFDTLDYHDIPTLLRAFKALKENKEALDNITKIVDALHQQCSYETIPKAFEYHEYDSIKIHGRLFTVGSRLNASIPRDKSEAGFDWIRREAKVPELIVPTVNSKSLSTVITAFVEQYGRLPPKDAVSLHIQTFTSVRKA